MDRSKLIAAVVAVAVSAGAGWGVGKAWDTFGWTTPERHTVDIVETQQLMKSVQVTIQELSRQEDERHKHWECDEAIEELRDLLRLTDLTPAQLIERTQLEQQIDEDDCHRF